MNAERPARLAVLDRLEVPDLWPEVSRRHAGGAPPRRPSGLRRAGIAAVALLVAALSFFVLLRGWPRGGTPAVSPPPTAVPLVGNGAIYFRSQIRPGVATPWQAISADGHGLHTVYRSSGSFIPDHVSFSPDGTRIAADLIGFPGIWVADADGTHAVELTDGPNDAWPAWSPDGNYIAFAGNTAPQACPPDRFEYGCRRDVYVMNADGTGVHIVARKGQTPTWSPNGQQIAFETTGCCSRTSITVVNADGTGEHVLARTAHGSDVAPSWSPDGRAIVYASIRNEDWGIFSMPAAGGTERTLVPAGSRLGYVDDPVWSPDGRFIAFVEDGGLGVMRPDSSHATTFFRQTTRYPAGAIAWRPVPATSGTVSPSEGEAPSVATVDVGPYPGSVGVGYGSVWVLAHEENPWRDFLVRIDARTNRVLDRIRLQNAHSDLAVGGGAIWIGSFGATGPRVLKVDPSTDRLVATIDGVAGPIAAQTDALWGFARQHSGNRTTLLRIDPSTEAVVARIEIPHPPSAFALVATDRSVWVLLQDGDPGHTASDVFEVDTRTNQVIPTAALRLGGIWGAADDHTAWVPAGRGAVGIDATSGKIVANVRAVGFRPFAVVDANVWFIEGPRGVCRLNARTLRVDTCVGIGPAPDLVAAKNPGAFDPTTGSLWVPNGIRTVTRIELPPPAG